ncbi:MAG: recombination-associated protein RdgC [Legionellaceae bacterium]|nr:recombination-associated protein RdgC [Legionellaceae bacterium]HCA90160.1 recombination-associated protein RdgC [Legionellales bacterium]|tara:strand:- start:3624 stop:4562 length:939 start_codon:yes stop_codon:yes gene_type:complete
MWFNNILIYSYTQDKNTLTLNDLLKEEALKPCPPHARTSYGWLPVRDDSYALEVAGSALICFAKEERILPKSVINQLLIEKITHLEQQGRVIRRSEKAQMCEELEFELLPKAFCLQKKLTAIFDTVNQYLIINTASLTQAHHLTALLRKTIPGLHLNILNTETMPCVQFAEWITHPDTLPAGFELGTDCLLVSRQDEKKRINCKGYELDATEITGLLAQDLCVTEISLIWQERIQFTLTTDLTLKRLKSLDYLLDEFNELKELDEVHLQQDAALALLSGELRELINALTSHLLKASNHETMPTTGQKTLEIA